MNAIKRSLPVGIANHLIRSILMKTIVLASDDIRDELREAVQGSVGDGISMAEFDYQLTRVQTRLERGWK